MVLSMVPIQDRIGIFSLKIVINQNNINEKSFHFIKTKKIDISLHSITKVCIISLEYITRPTSTIDGNRGSQKVTLSRVPQKEKACALFPKLVE